MIGESTVHLPRVPAKGSANVLDVEELGKRATVPVPHASASDVRMVEADPRGDHAVRVTLLPIGLLTSVVPHE